jgi:hypothetical protein
MPETLHSACDEKKDGEQYYEEDDDGSYDVNILTKEIESWKDFEYALREENRLLINKMLSKCQENEDYIRAASSKDECLSAENLFSIINKKGN